MRKGTHTTLSSLLFQRQGLILVLLFFFMAGLSSGVFVELFMGAEEKLLMCDYLTQNLLGQRISAVASSSIFLQSAANNLGLLLLLMVAGISVIGFPAVFLAVAYKGMTLGFSSALLIQCLSVKGIKLIVFSMVPQNLLLLPALLLAALTAVNFAASAYAERGKGVKKSLMQLAGPYLTLFIFLALLVLAGCLVEAFISPALLPLAE